MKIDALGFIEVRGLVAAIEAGDAMLKAARVRLVRQHQVNPGLITLAVEGDLAACRAAVDAGVAAAARVGEVVSRLEIGRPDEDTETMVLALIDASSGEGAAKPASRKETLKKPPEPAPVKKAEAAKKPETRAQGGAADSRAALAAFVAKAGARGRSWAEIEKAFPEYAGRERILEGMVREGALRKKGRRYLRGGQG